MGKKNEKEKNVRQLIISTDFSSVETIDIAVT